MSEINVTPLVDVMLVLLIVFMVTAPLLATGVKVDLPQASAPPLEQDDKPLSVTVAADGVIYVQQEPASETEFLTKMAAVTGANPDARIYVRGDAVVAYGRVMEVMGILREAGYGKVALVTRPRVTGANAATGTPQAAN
ncbi:MAG: protein TolR [Rhodospirillaceae bacterium]